MNDLKEKNVTFKGSMIKKCLEGVEKMTFQRSMVEMNGLKAKNHNDI